MSKDGVSVLVTFEVAPDRIELFKSLMNSIRIPTQAEPGCLRYELQQSVQNPCSFVFVEHWASEEDMTCHLETPHVQAISSQLRLILVSAPKVDRYRPVW